MRDLARQLAQRLPSPIYRAIHRMRVRRATARFPERIITRSYGHGVTLRLSIQDALAEGWYDRVYEHDCPEIAASRDHGLRRGARVFDIGAHQAVVALVLADIVGEDGVVVAVEADRHNVRVAEINIALNGVSNVTVLNAACASAGGMVAFHEGLNGRIVAGRLGAHRVRAVTIDQLAEMYGTPDVVYIDIEGHEAAALEGAVQVRELGVTFVIEVHASGQLQAAGGSVAQIVHCLRSQGYDLRYVTDSDWWSGTALRPFPAREFPTIGRFFLLASTSRAPRAAA